MNSNPLSDMKGYNIVITDIWSTFPVQNNKGHDRQNFPCWLIKMATEMRESFADMCLLLLFVSRLFGHITLYGLHQ